MHGKRIVVVAAALLLAFVTTGWTATFEVSQPVQVTSNAYYERGQSIVYDGSSYWLFYGRSASCTDPYSIGTPDIHDYAIYYKKASSVPGLASATAVAVPGATDCYLGETGAAVVDGNVWTFGTVPSVSYPGAKSLYGWYTGDGGSSWTQVADLWDDMPDGAAHHDEIGFDGKLYIMANYAESYTGWYSKWTDDPTAGSITWSTPIPLNSTSNLINGTGHFYAEGTSLYIGILRTSPTKDNKVLEYAASPESWTELCTASSTGWDGTLFKVGSDYVYAQAPWVSPRQYIIAWSGASPSTVLSGSSHMVSEARYGSNGWVDMWPIGFTDDGGTSYLFYTSERDQPSAEGTGNIWYFEVDWTVSNDHYTYIQEAINAAVGGDVIEVDAGTYAERLSISSGIDLRGVQYGVDPNLGGRTDPSAESTVTEAGLSTPNPDVLIEVEAGATNASVDGFTLNGDPTNPTADTSTLRIWANDVTVGNNIIDGRLCVLYKGGTGLTLNQNDMEGNKGGVTLQPGASSGVTITDNSIAIGPSPAGDESGVYMTSCSSATVSGNAISGFTSRGIGGSANSNIAISGNALDSNKDGVSYWGGTTFVDITGNDITNSTRYGINIKGQDINIDDNVISGSTTAGISIDMHAIATERVSISGNDLSGNTGSAVLVNTVSVAETIDASGNYWGSTAAATVRAEANAGDGVDYTPWTTGGTALSPGYAADYSTLHVDDDSPQGGGAGGRVQEGIDLVTGSTVYIEAGTYNERPVANKSVTITGANEASVIIDAGAGATGTYGFSVTADDVTITDLTLVGDVGLSTPRYGFKPSGVSNFTLSHVTAKEFYRTGVDLLGVTNGDLDDVTSIDNDGHGLAVTDCNNVDVTNLTVSGNAWQGVSVATWGRYYPLGTSGIVFDGTNSFVDPFQLEMGDYNNPGVPPAGDAIITYSTNIGDGADVTVQSSDFGFAVHGEQDDAPDQVRIWFAPDLATAALLPAVGGPVGHFTGNDMYIESLTDPTQLYITPGCDIQAAVDAASNGYTIDVEPGTYAQSVIVDKSVALYGAAGAQIVPGISSPGFYAKTDDLIIAGFEIHTCSQGVLGWLDTPDYTANPGYSNLKLLDNTIYDTNGSRGFGIYLGTESERYDPSDPLGIYDPSLTSLLDFTGLEISGNEIYNTAQASVVLQSITTTGDPLEVCDNDLHDSTYSGLWIDASMDIDVLGNLFDGNSNGVFFSNYGDGYYEGTPGGTFDPAGILVEGNIFTGNTGKGVAIYDGTPSAMTITGNSFVGNGGHGAYNFLSSSVDATLNWWGDPTGPYHATSNPGGLGDTVSDYVTFVPYLSGNIICDPDPEYLTADAPTKTLDVNYLGGGGGLMYGYDVTFTWDGAVASTSTADVTEGTLLSGGVAGTTFFSKSQMGNSITVNCIQLGAQPGVTGPGTMFSVEFTGLAVGTSTVDITVTRVRDSANQTLSGFHDDDGLLIVDVSDPVISSVEITNDTLTHTDDYVKDGDTVTITANVADDDPAFGPSNIEADLTVFGGGGAVNPDTYVAPIATWQLVGVTCSPSDGVIAVSVDATDDIGNDAAQGSDDIIADNTAPSAVAGFDASPAHEECGLTWTDASGNDPNYEGVAIRRYADAGAYPDYTVFVGMWPGVDTQYPATHAAGDVVYDGTGASYADGVVDRNIYYYQAFCYDWARNYSVADAGARDLATNYWLGDVSDGWGSWGYDGLVDANDILKLSDSYGQAPPAGNDAECDVGPTVHPDWHRLGLPKPDDIVEFEDAMIFAMNYGVVTLKIVPFLPEEYNGDVLALTLEEREVTGEELEVALTLEGNSSEVKGMSASVAFDPSELEFVTTVLTGDMSSPLADVFFWSGASDGRVIVDALVLGTGVTIGGSGDIATLTFRTVGDSYALEVESARIRNADNEELDAKLGNLESGGDTPLVFRLVQNSPNPFNPVTKVAYHVPRESDVTIRVYDVSGRVVRTLVDRKVEPGRHEAVWDGRNDAGESVGSGIYFCTMEAPDFHDSRKMTLLK